MLRNCILVADDDPNLRGIDQGSRTYRGYTVETAENGYDALTKLDQEGVDGVLLDERMPGITGVAVSPDIRQHQPLRPVVMMPGETRIQMAARVRGAGARACFVKLCDFGILAQMVRRWFGTAA